MTTSSSVRVLLVTAHDEDYRFLRSMLPRTSWTVTRTCDNSLSETLGRVRPDVVIVDDAGDWRCVSERVSHALPSARVIVASRLADERLWLEVLDAGIFDLIRKPFEPREVASVLKGAAREEELSSMLDTPVLAAAVA